MIANAGRGARTFGRELADAHALLLAELTCRPRELPGRLASRQGTWRGQALTLTAQAFEADRLRYGRLVTISGEDVDIANLLCLPDPRRRTPMLGIDLVRVRPDHVVIAADLVPTLPPVHARASGTLPRWAEAFFSADPLVYRGAPEGSATPLAAMWHRVQSFARELRADAEARGADEECDHTARLAWQDAYCHAHRRDDRALGLLGRMFGEEWAQEFIDVVMFPVVTTDLGDLALTRLRAATRTAHRAVEAVVTLMRGDATRDDYVRFLRATAACAIPIEARIAETTLPGPWSALADRPRARWLAQDLAALGCSMPDTSGPVPVPETPAHAAGAAYVLEGATLGGQLLARHLRSTLDIPESALNYLQSHGAELGSRWRTFRTGLGGFMAGSSEHEQAAILGAQRTFAAFLAAYAGR